MDEEVKIIFVLIFLFYLEKVCQIIYVTFFDYIYMFTLLYVTGHSVCSYFIINSRIPRLFFSRKMQWIYLYTSGMQNGYTKSYTPTQRGAYNCCIRSICAVYKFLGGTEETITRRHL